MPEDTGYLGLEDFLEPLLGMLDGDSRKSFTNFLSEFYRENDVFRPLALKPARHEFREEPEQIIRFMSSTGG